MSKVDLSKFRLRDGISADIRKRSSVLKALEGWFQVPVILDPVTEELYNEYQGSGNRLKFTRWLSNIKKLDNTIVSEIGRNIQTTSVKLSCRYSDLTRLAETKNYVSCFRTFSYGKQQLKYLSDPDVAVLYIPDKAGKYLWRSIIRLVVDDAGKHCIVHHRAYGNGPSEAIFKTISEVTGMRVIAAFDNRFENISEIPDPNPKVMYSPTVHNNSYPLWTEYSDHLIYIDHDTLRIGIRVVKD